MAKPRFLRRWTYDTYFGGVRTAHYPLSMTEAEVRADINAAEGSDNWRKDALKRGQKVKEKNAYPR